MTADKAPRALTLPRTDPGWEAAWRELVEAHESRILHTALHVLRNYHTAEQVKQEVFTKILRGSQNYVERGRFNAYVNRTTINACLTEIRSRAARPPEQAMPLGTPGFEAVPGVRQGRQPTTVSLDEIFERNHLPGYLMAALARIPEDFARAFVLQELFELTDKQIAEIEGVAVGTARSRMSRARVALRQELAKDEVAWPVPKAEETPARHTSPLDGARAHMRTHPMVARPAQPVPAAVRAKAQRLARA